MRILQTTNIICHHQIPLARQLAALTDDNNFRFAATQPPSSERLKLGWNCSENDPWILRAGENQADRNELDSWWAEADVVLCGERQLDKIKQRLNNGKLTFYMSERWWKPIIGIARLLHPRFVYMSMKFCKLAKSPFFHYLPIGDYAAIDMLRIAPFHERMWRWGYFTSVPNPLPDCEKNVHGFRILWAGRMLALKNVDTLIKSFSRLLTERSDATLTLVGDGPERQSLEKLAKRLLAVGSYRFLPSQPISEVHKLMRQSHVYVLPSNAYEGWGAVINEAMSEGCTVIASEAAGAAKSMIRHGENGLLFSSTDWLTLTNHLITVAADASFRRSLAKEGQRTIVECWSPDVAADRLFAFSTSILKNIKPQLYANGPMSLFKNGSCL